MLVLVFSAAKPGTKGFQHLTLPRFPGTSPFQPVFGLCSRQWSFIWVKNRAFRSRDLAGVFLAVPWCLATGQQTAPSPSVHASKAVAFFQQLWILANDH